MRGYAPALITDRQAAAMLGITTRHLRRLRRRGDITPVGRFGRTLLYYRYKVRQLKSHRMTRPVQLSSTWIGF